MKNSLKVDNFSNFVSEATLKGNKGIPEEWLKMTMVASDQDARRFEMENMRDIRNFMGMVRRAMELQQGKEKELSKLAERVVRALFGSLIDDVVLDFKIVSGKEVADVMEETDFEMEDMSLEELKDEKIKDEIMFRKIFRTFQQGKGLNSKASLNLSKIANDLKEILGEEKGSEMIPLLNKISNVAQFFDWSTPREMQERMWKNQDPAGACSIKIKPLKIEDAEDLADKIIKDSEKGIDITQSDASEELLDGVESKIIARGQDFSVLLHEGIKGVYMLISQVLLMAVTDELGEEATEIVRMNTDTKMDELEEIAFGVKLMSAVSSMVEKNKRLSDKIYELTREMERSTDASIKDDLEQEIFSLKEKMHFLFMSMLSSLSPASKRLEILKSILMGEDSPEMQKIVDSALDYYEEEEQYQRSKMGSPMASTGSTSTADAGQPEEDYSQMSSSEIEDLIDIALGDRDFKKVEVLKKFLKENFSYVDPERKYTKRVTYESIFENVQQAKSFLVKMEADRRRKDPKTFSEEEKKAILSNPDFKKILDLTSKNQGYTYLFTKFFFDEKASFETLVEILGKLRDYKQLLGELPMKVEDYANVEKTNDDNRPGYERLGDDLIGIERKRQLKELYNEFSQDIKKQIREASPEDVEKLIDIITKSKKIGENFYKESILGYGPTEKDPNVMGYNLYKYKDLQEFIDFAVTQINSYMKDAASKQSGERRRGGPYADLIDKFEETAEVGVLYDDKDYLVLSIRSADAQFQITGDLSLCIAQGNSTTYWNYTKGRIQLAIFNFNLPFDNKFYSEHMTITMDGKIHEYSDKNNNKNPSGYGGKSYISLLEAMGYPNDLIESVKNKFNEEFRMRLSFEALHKLMDEKNVKPEAIIKFLVGVNKSLADGLMTKDQWDKISGTVSKYASEVWGISKDKFLEAFRSYGIFSDGVWNIFDSVVGKDFTSKDMQDILKSTESGFEDFKYIVSTFSSLPSSIRDNEIQSKAQEIKDILKNKDYLINKIKSNI
jgi:hypothetical protein